MSSTCYQNTYGIQLCPKLLNTLDVIVNKFTIYTIIMTIVA